MRFSSSVLILRPSTLLSLSLALAAPPLARAAISAGAAITNPSGIALSGDTATIAIAVEQHP